MSDSPKRQMVALVAAWIWVVGIGSAIAGYLTHKPYAPPRLGEHVDELMSELGYDDEMVAAFKSRGVFA